MAKDKKSDKEPTREEKAVKTLEDTFNLNLVGSNMLKREPYAFGQIGNDAGKLSYRIGMQSDEGEKRRKAIYDSRLAEAEQLGIAEEPPMPGNYDVMNYTAKIINENQALLPLGDLEKAVSKVAGNLGFEVPKELRDKRYADVQAEIMKRLGEANGDAKKVRIDEEDIDAQKMYQVLTQAYELGAAKKVFDANYLAPISGAGKKIAEKYAPEPKK